MGGAWGEPEAEEGEGYNATAQADSLCPESCQNNWEQTWNRDWQRWRAAVHLSMRVKSGSWWAHYH